MNCHLAPVSAAEAVAEKEREKEHWERAKQLGEHARAAGQEEVERRLAQVGGWVGLFPGTMHKGMGS